MGPRLIIGLPVYNGARFVGEALDSLLRQDVEGAEIVVSDNGSTDETPSVCRGIASRDSRVRYFREGANRGPTWNFNRVLQHAPHAPYFMWAAADDRWAPDYASSCIRFLELHPEAGLCGTFAAFVPPEGGETVEIDLGGSTLGLGPAARAAGYLRFVDRNSIFYGVFRSRLLEGRRLENRVAADHAFLLELAVEAPFHVIPEVKLWRRTGGTSRSVASIARTLGVPLAFPGPLARLEILRSLLAGVRRLGALSEADRRRLRRECVLSTFRRFVRRRLGRLPRSVPASTSLR
jgi:glycosyltransferase involved in cell wall biosynthesis